MSCSKCGSVTASCGCKDTAYTTPKVYTCPPDTSCPQPVRCSEFMDAACIFLNDGIADAGIQPGSSLESIVQQLILLVTNPGCVDAPGGVPGGGTVTFIDAVWPGNAITIAGGPISNSGTFVFNGNGNSNQYIDGQGNLQPFPAISDPVEFQTNGTPNSTQVLLNLVAGTGITLTESGGSVVIDADANIYTVDNGLSADPTDANNFQLGSQSQPGAPLIHDTYIAGSQFRFEINNTNSMFLQGNRVDIEGAAAGAMLLSTGGAADSSVEVTGVQVAIESTASSNTTKIFLDPTKIRVQTPLYNLKDNGDVLTLIDKTTGEVEYMPVVGILLQTDGSDNGDQELLNLVSGNGITLTNTGGDVVIDGPLFQTNGTDNSVQTLLNLVAGTGITLTESAGSVTIDAAAPAINLTTFDFGGPATYDPVTGDLNIPIYQTQLDIQDEGNTVVINPDWLNFIGDAVNVTLSGTGADITITGGQYNGDQGVWKETSSLPETFMLGAPLGNGTAIRFLEDREVDVDTNRLEMIGSSNILRLIESGATPADTDAALVVASDTTFYAGTFTGVNNPALLAYTTGTDTYALEVTNLGTGTSSYAALFQSDPGYGIQVNSLLQSSFYLNATGSSNNSIDNVLYIWKNTTGVASVGEGTSITMSPGTDGTGSLIPDGVVLNSILSASTDVEFRIDTTNAGTLQPSTTFKGDGEIRFHEYGVGTFADTATYILGVDASGNVVETTVAGLTITVDSAPFSSSTAIDFVSSADINITDLGGGQITFDLANPPIFYNSDEGVYNDSDIFKLGAPNATGVPGGSSGAIPFAIDREVNTDVHTLFFTGTAITNQYVLDVTNTVGSGVKATSNLGIAIDAYGNSGSTVIQATSAGTAVGVTGSSKNKYGGNFQSTNLIGLSTFTESTYPSAVVAQTPLIAATASQVLDTLSIYRGVNAPGPIALLTAGGGSAILTALDGLPVNSVGGTSTAIDASRLVTKWFTAQSVSEFSIETKNVASTTLDAKFTILGGGTSGPFSLLEGQIKFNKYAAGAIYKSANDLSTNSGFNLGIDANGNIWATDFSTTTGPVSGVSSISIGTLTNGATATISNPSGPAASVNITGQNAYTQITADSGTASADVYNSQFSVVGADGITTSVTNNPMPASDVITVTGPDKFLNFVTKNISGTTIATYTPTIWNETLNIQAGTGITITNGGSANTIVISGGPGTGTVSNVTGVNGNGFTVDVTNGTTTPAITVGTSITGVLVGNGTAVSAVTGTGVMVFSGTGYTFQPLPTVNNGALNVVMGTNAASGIAVQWGTNTGFTANIATNIQYDLRVGPALVNLATYMSQVLPPNPTPGAGVLATRPVYIRKSAIDNYTDATPVTTFSPGTTGFTVTSGYSTATALGINENVVLGGVLNVSSGGTGLSTTPGNGQILIGNGTGYTLANISGGAGINVINTAGGIQIQATGLTGPSPLNGIHIHTLDGSIRLGSGTPADGDTIRPLIERTDIRMNGQIYRLSNLNQGYISDVGFQIDDAAGQKIGYLGSSTSTSVTAANPPQVGFVFSGVGGTALATYNGVYIDNTGAEAKVYSGFSSSVRQVITRSATLANNKLIQQGTWGNPGTADSTFYEAIPSARTIQIGSTAGNNNWIKLDDANQRVDFNKSTIYASGYGSGAVTSGTGLTYLIGTDVGGKFFEFAGRSISQITGNTGTFSAASMASATAPVPFSIQGSGTISTSIAGNVLTITNSATAFPYWGTINLSALAGSSGNVIGDANVIPNTVGANTLNLIAGNNITFTGADASNRIQISAGTANAWYNIAVANGSAAGGSGTLVPDAAQDTLTFAGGTGISVSTLDIGGTLDRVVITNTGVTSVTGGGGTTVTSSTGSVTISSLVYDSNEGVFKAPGDVFKLGAPNNQANALATIPFLEDRFINGNNTNTNGTGYKLDIQTPIGAGRGVLHLTSTNVGRALRAVNNLITSSNPEGAIYASSNQPGSTDSNPTGTIYAEVTGVPSPISEGSAIVGKGVMISGENIRPAIFGSGYIAVKGYNIKGQVESPSTFLAGGIGVWGASVYSQALVPGDESESVWGVVGSTISNTNLILPYICNTGTGVYGEATGANRGNYGTASDNTTFAARFATRTTGVLTQPNTQPAGLTIPLGLRHMANVTDVVQIVRRSNNNVTQNVNGIGGAIVFNVEGQYSSTLNDGIKAGRIGYKLSRVVTPANSRFFITTVAGQAAGSTVLDEVERLAIRSDGQVELSAYSYLSPAVPSIQGMFAPEEAPATTGFTDNYDYIIPAAKTQVVANDERMGRLDTLRTRHGQYDPATIVIGGTTGYNAVNLSPVINRAYYTSINNIVTVHVNGSIAFGVTTANITRTFDMPLPIPANTAFLNGDVVFQLTLNNYKVYQYITQVAGSNIAGQNQRYRISIPNDLAYPSPSTSTTFSAIFTYKLI